MKRPSAVSSRVVAAAIVSLAIGFGLSNVRAEEPGPDWKSTPSYYEIGLTLGEAFDEVWLAEPAPAPAPAPPSNPILNISPAGGKLVPDWRDESYIQAVDFGFDFDQQEDDGSQEADTKQEGDETEVEDEEFQDDSGNDPRDFRNKFMPYFRYTELRNGLEAYELTLFGLYAITPRIAMTYELPAFKYVDGSDAVPSGPRFGPGGPQTPGPPLPGFGGNLGPNFDPYSFGMGDLILRAFWKPEALEFKMPAFTWGPRKGEEGGLSVMPLLETTLPTHTDDLLGNDEWILSPGFVVAGDTPTMGFVAAMFFYDFNAIKDSDVAYTSRVRARIFVLQPFSKPGPGFLDGWYTMPEFQPIYDFREQRFSLWIGPEFGKIVQPTSGKIKTLTFYAKPGWGWNKDSFQGDREFTFEVGVRIFL